MPLGKGLESGMLLLMVVVQATFGKVIPLQDILELSNHAEGHTGRNVIDICNKT